MTPGGAAPESRPSSPADSADQYRTARLWMVREQIELRGVSDGAVLGAMRKVPRHRFVPADSAESAYQDRPLPIGDDQTISQPYIVAFMTAALQLRPTSRVLEVGTGSGYQAAVLAEVCREVYSIEIVENLANQARKTLGELGYRNVHVRAGDGYRGWPEHAPFDAIVVTAAPEHVPQPLLDQLAVGGRMVLPVGGARQELVILEKTAAGTTRRSVLPVRFVPMTGEARRR
ncbi:MAG: protein-L-isoaspartate(D-aspartate) O-methyltransferase [Planctomycetes bacterium]|nr:protein-L-isoaspartate(D-aspartate) O-methyltransferase [Planctomycetota bacterium]